MSFLIGPVNDGMRKDVKPYAIPEDAFQYLTNAYQWRGRIVRRQGYTLLGRPFINLQAGIVLSILTNGSNSYTIANVFTDPNFNVNQYAEIIPGSVDITVSGGGGVYLDDGSGNLSSANGSGTINYSTGALSITFNIGSIPVAGNSVTLKVNYYPSLPIMGLKTREQFGIDQQQLIAFDTTKAYNFTGTAFPELASTMLVTWSGTDSQFFWTTNYANAFWATNSKSGLNGYAVTAFAGVAGAGPWTVNITSAGNTFQVGDQIYFLNVAGAGTVANNNLRQAVVTIAGNPFTVSATIGGAFVNGATTSGVALSTTRTVTGQDGIRWYGLAPSGTWVNYNPPISPTVTLIGALMIFAYRGYLVFLNTTEGNEQGVFNFGNRARWTQIGTPYYSAPVPIFPAPQTFDPKAVRDDIFGRGGANDAPTNETIVSAGFIRNILVVYFERSTWQLRFNNSAQNPFVWERVNVDYGSDCTFSGIVLDKGLMSIGNRGITISDGNDTVRFDEKIPDDIFEIRQTNQGLQRVYGIRTFRTRLIYWTFPSNLNPNLIYPERVLVFNYDTKNWAYFDDSFTCFGYYYTGGLGQTWNDLTEDWQSYTNVSWDSGVTTAGFESIVAGNQQGYILWLEQQSGINGISLGISNLTGSIVTSHNHNLSDGDWIILSGILGITYSDGVSLNGRNFKVANPSGNANTFTLQEYEPIIAPNASGASFTYNIGYTPIMAGSVQVNVGTLVFTDVASNGLLTGTGGNGTVDYSTGALSLSFSPSIGSSAVNIRVVSLDPEQVLSVISTTGTYGGLGKITKISNYIVQTKIFNFFGDDKRSRLSKIDFYLKTTSTGQFACNVLSDSSNNPINTPLDNPQSNFVLSSLNPYEFGNGEQTIYRLYCDAIAQTVQLQLTMDDHQIAVSAINTNDFELTALMIDMKRGGRLP